MLRSTPLVQVFSYLTQLKATTTFTNGTSLMTSNGHGLQNGDCVHFTNNGGALPTGIAAATNYYVINKTTNTFQVATTLTGTAVGFSDDGSGTNSFNLKGKVINVEDFDHICLGFATAGNANLTVKAQGSMQDNVDFNASQSTTNIWDYVDMKDLEDNASIAGDTGIALTGTDDCRNIEVNVNGLARFTMAITAWSAGTMEVKVKRFIVSK